MEKRVILFAALLLFFLVPAPSTLAECVICGDVNGSNIDFSEPDVSDFTTLLNYLYLGGDPIACPDLADIDNIPGITNSDLTKLSHYLYFSYFYDDLYCPPSPDTTAPVFYTDTVEFLNIIVPSGVDSWQVDIRETVNNGIYGLSLPIKFGCPGTDLVLDSIETDGLKYLTATGSIIDPVNNKFYIWFKK